MKRTVLLLVVLGALFVFSTAAYSGQAAPPHNVSITAPKLSIVSISPLKSGDCDLVIGNAINRRVVGTYPTGISCRISPCDFANSKNIEVLKI